MPRRRGPPQPPPDDNPNNPNKDNERPEEESTMQGYESEQRTAISGELDISRFDTAQLALPDIMRMLGIQRQEEALRREEIAHLYHALADDINRFSIELHSRYIASALGAPDAGLHETLGNLRNEWLRVKRLAQGHEQAAQLLRTAAGEQNPRKD